MYMLKVAQRPMASSEKLIMENSVALASLYLQDLLESCHWRILNCMIPEMPKSYHLNLIKATQTLLTGIKFYSSLKYNIP